MMQVRELALPETVAVADRMTDDEFFQYAPDDRKAELIDGVFYMPDAPSDSHERLNIFLITLLRIYVEEKNLGEVRGSKTAVNLAVGHDYEPDVLFVARHRTGIIEHQGIFGAPDLAVEILSPGTAHLDRGLKRRTYAQAGVRELWLLDPDSARKSAFYQQRGEDGLVEIKPEGGVIRSLAIPGFWLKTEWLWPPQGRLPRVAQVLRELGAL